MSSSNGSTDHASEARRLNDDIERFARNVDRALRKHPREAFTTETPLEHIFAAEKAAHCPRCDFQIGESYELEQWAIRNETLKRLSEFCSQDGLEPWKVMRNFYAVMAYMRLEPWCELTVREKGLMLGDSHGSEHFRMEKMVNFVRRTGGSSFKAPGQKEVVTRETYSKCQQGNTNRRRQLRPRHPHLREKLKKLKHE